MDMGVACVSLHILALIGWIAGPSWRKVTWFGLIAGRFAILLAVWMPTTAELQMVPVPESPVIVVTGGTKGVGAGFVGAVASTLADRNPRIIVLARSLPANSSIAENDFVRADFSSVASVADTVKTLHERTDRVDLLVLNAGMGELERESRLTDEGLSLSVAVNYLSQVALYEGLAPMLEASPLNRMVLVTSMAHMGGSPSMATQSFDVPFRGSGPDAYSVSKLQQVVYGKALARRSSTHVTSVHPGCIASSIFDRDRDDPRMFLPDMYGSREVLAPLGPVVATIGQQIMSWMWESTDVAGRRILWAALDNSTTSGDYVANFGQLNRYTSPYADDEAVGDTLFAETKKALTRLVPSH
jgi:NAD(P)-dependent dehydrogenase (short-subunit alcohol dehydrogenase family)